MNGNEYDGLDFGESCDYDVHECNEQLTAENAKLRAELAEAVAALRTLNDEMSVVAYSGFDPERWGERIGALDAAGRVLAKHAATA